MPTKWLQVRVSGSKYGSGMPPQRAFCGEQLTDLIRTSIYDKYSGSLNITSHLDDIGHCKQHLVIIGKYLNKKYSDLVDTRSRLGAFVCAAEQPRRGKQASVAAKLRGYGVTGVTRN